MAAIRYNNELKGQWDRAVKNASNSTFLFERAFMDYHKDRFTDCSLLFTDGKNNSIGALPANLRTKDQTVQSHGGLTYGGLLVPKSAHLLDVKEMLKEAALVYLKMGARSLEYKPTPHIYHSYPSQEDLYWLFRAGANLSSRTVSTTIDLQDPLSFSTLRKRKIKKAQTENFILSENDPAHWAPYWNILSEVLQSQHHTQPVHSLDEIKRLAAAFPKNIQLFTVQKDNICIAGCLIFECGSTIHVQYISANAVGKQLGALDYLFSRLIPMYQAQGKRYFDFGISTEDKGHWLNEGLLFQKEGFGGRAICYDTYMVDLERLSLL